MDTKISILFYGGKAKTTKDNLLPIYLRVTRCRAGGWN